MPRCPRCIQNIPQKWTFIIWNFQMRLCGLANMKFTWGAKDEVYTSGLCTLINCIHQIKISSLPTWEFGVGAQLLAAPPPRCNVQTFFFSLTLTWWTWWTGGYCHRPSHGILGTKTPREVCLICWCQNNRKQILGKNYEDKFLTKNSDIPFGRRKKSKKIFWKKFTANSEQKFPKKKFWKEIIKNNSEKNSEKNFGKKIEQNFWRKTNWIESKQNSEEE